MKCKFIECDRKLNNEWLNDKDLERIQSNYAKTHSHGSCELWQLRCTLWCWISWDAYQLSFTWIFCYNLIVRVVCKRIFLLLRNYIGGCVILKSFIRRIQCMFIFINQFFDFILSFNCQDLSIKSTLLFLGNFIIVYFYCYNQCVIMISNKW